MNSVVPEAGRGPLAEPTPGCLARRSSLLVVDVGNTRIKWGLCRDDAVDQIASLPPDDPVAWQAQLDIWQLTGPLQWAVSGVHPQRRDRLADWLVKRGGTVAVVSSHKQLPLDIAVGQPDKVGIDRLLNAVAVNSRRRPHTPACIVDAGSAVTVDFVDDKGTFLGGAILPGFRLMAQALHEHTALLPLVDIDNTLTLPATSTAAAINAGVYCAVAGGIRMALESVHDGWGMVESMQLFLSGGDGPKLTRHLPHASIYWPEMTLEGLRLTATHMAGRAP